MTDDPFKVDQPEVPVIPTVKFEDLVGAGKKYKTPEDAANAIAHKDAFIEQLKREASEAREALQKRLNEEEFLTKLETLTRGTPSEPQNQPGDTEVKTTAVTPEDIERIIEKRDAEKQRKANLDAAVGKLQEVFGDDYRRHIQRQAQVLGMSTADLTDMAARSPQAFLKLVGADGSNQPLVNPNDAFNPPPRSSLQSSITPSGNVKDYSYFSRLRQEKGEGWYFSLPVQQEIWEQAKRQGGDPVSKTGFYKS